MSPADIHAQQTRVDDPMLFNVGLASEMVGQH